MPNNKRLTILSQSEIDELSNPPKLTEQEREYVFQFNDHEKAFIKPLDTPQTTVFFILLLGYFKDRPVKLDVSLKQAAQDIDYISKQHFPGTTLRLRELTASQKSRIYNDIFTATGIARFEEKEVTIRQTANDAARYDIDLRSIFRVTLDSIQIHDCQIPKYYILQDIVSKAYNGELDRLKNSLDISLCKGTQNMLLNILVDSDAPTFVSNLKKPTKSFEEKDYAIELAAFNVIEPLYDELKMAVEKLSISNLNISYFSALVDYYTVSKLKNMPIETVRIYLVCYLTQRYRMIIDRFFESFVYWIRKIDKDAVDFSKKEVLQQAKELKEKVTLAAQVLDLHSENRDTVGRLYSEHLEEVYNLIEAKDLLAVADYMRSLGSDNRIYYWEYISKTGRKKIQGLVRKIFLSLNFISTTENDSLLHQVNTLRSEVLEFGQCKTLDLRLIYGKNRPFLSDENNTLISARCEFSIFKVIKDKLEKCAWYVKNGDGHRPLEDELIPEAFWAENKAEILRDSGSALMQKDINNVVSDGIALLTRRIENVDKAIKQNKSESVVLTDSGGEFSWTVKRVKKLDDVNDKYFQSLPQVKVSDIIQCVSTKTEFYKSLKGMRGRKDASVDLGKMAAVLIAKATRMGLNKMADRSPYTYDELKTFQANFFRVETMQEAVDAINENAYQLSIFNHYNLRNNILHASIDGQKFSSRKTTTRTRHSSKYLGQEKGLTGITIVINHFPAGARLAALNTHESHFAYDLLFNNNSVIQPDVLTTDNHGINKCNFALLDCEGFQFAPRYADLGRVINSLFKVVRTEDSWQLKLRVDINAKKITENWDYTQRIFMSLRRKEISQSTFVRKLSKSAVADKMLSSLLEYDRLLKCLYVLELMEDIDLRRYLQHVLNRGEAYHQLQRAIEDTNGPGGFIGENDRMMDESLASAQLLSSCIIFFNAYLLSLSLDRHRELGNTLEVEHLKRISPVAWSYINMSGQFAFDESAVDIDALFKLLIGQQV